MELVFHGGAGEVTGSCYRITIQGRQVLFDCGLIQGGAKEEKRNAEPFPFEPAAIDAVVLSHAHLDHAGRLPMLVKAGFRGPIYTHRATRDLCRILLKDAANLQLRDNEWDNQRRARKHMPAIEPLYTLDDVYATLRRIVPLDYQEECEVVPGLTVRLRDAGHILGSAIVDASLSENGVERRLVFSGDLGHPGAPILRDTAVLTEADIVLMESTYGNRCHRSTADTEAELTAIFSNPASLSGNIVIPAFSIGRSQDLLYLMARNYERWNIGRWHIFLDSPMAIEATEVYLRYSGLYGDDAKRLVAGTSTRTLMAERLPNLRFTRTPEQSMAINKIRSGAIIIAGSGMCNGGRVRHHLKHLAWRQETQILMVGFQARGTPGRALVDGARQLRLFGETIRIGAKVHTIGGLSAHAGQPDLIRWYSHFRDRPPLWLVHGEPEASATLADTLSVDNPGRIHVAEPGQCLDLVHARIL